MRTKYPKPLDDGDISPEALILSDLTGIIPHRSVEGHSIASTSWPRQERLEDIV